MAFFQFADVFEPITGMLLANKIWLIVICFDRQSSFYCFDTVAPQSVTQPRWSLSDELRPDSILFLLMSEYVQIVKLFHFHWRTD